jgi:NAD(P)-dependent dehydrogenase (short-subunit alcohol dehydrogenase family)
MSPHHGNKGRQASEGPSKDMAPLPDNILPIFIKNQFRTTIDLPTTGKYPDVKGKCAIVTGSNTGLGFEASSQLLSLGLSHLVMGVRSIARGSAAASRLQSAYPSATIDVWPLDMESYKSVQDFAQKCQEDLPRIDVVILNAGISAGNFSTVAETGHEKTMQVNHFGTALLAVLLLPILKRKTAGKQPPKLIIVNSLTAHLCKVPNREIRPFLPSFDDTAVTPYDAEERYGVSKMVNQLFIAELAERISPEDVIINMVDPGLTKGTGLFRDAKGLVVVVFKIFAAVAARPLNRAAASYIDAAFGHGAESHGCFLMSLNVSP